MTGTTYGNEVEFVSLEWVWYASEEQQQDSFAGECSDATYVTTGAVSATCVDCGCVMATIGVIGMQTATSGGIGCVSATSVIIGGNAGTYGDV